MGSYDQPNYTIRREYSGETVAGANGVSGKFMHFQALRVKAFHAQVTTAGTSAGAGNCAILKAGTTALATATLGTSTAGVSVSVQQASGAGLGDVASLAALTVTNGTDATGKCIFSVEYELLPTGTKSP